jgi:hypothetical protein
MWSYVEYLRATRALRIVAVLLGLMLVGALLIRLSWGVPSYSPPSARDYYAELEHSPTARVVHERLRNGNTRTIVDDPKREVYAIIDRQGSAVVDFTLAHTKEAAEDRRLHRASQNTAEMTVTTFDTTTTARPARSNSSRPGSRGVAWTWSPLELDTLFEMTLPLGLLVATLLAGPLSKENNGHLEVAWTKPVSREQYGFAVVLVDVLTLIVAQAVTALALVAAASFWGFPKLGFQTSETLTVVTALAGPIAWYAWLTALSASLKRGPGIALGIGWVVAIVVPWIAAGTHDASTPVGRSVHAIFDAASYLIPLSYIWGKVEVNDPARALAIGLAALVALSAVSFALAVAQWRRLEA